MRYRIPLLGALAVSAIFAAAYAASDKPAALSAEEIINKHVAAVGGKDALAKFTSRIAIGTVQREGDSPARMAIMSEGSNRVSAMYLFSDLTWQLTNDSGKTIFRPLFKNRSLGPVQIRFEEMLASGTLFNDISLCNIINNPNGLGTSGVKMEAKGTKKVRGKQAYVVELKREHGHPIQLFFDAETFMWVRTDYGEVRLSEQMQQFTNDVTSHSEDEVNDDFYLDTWDFRDVDGVKLPFKFEQVVSTPILKQRPVGTITGVITEYRNNAPIDPKMFQ